MISITVLVENTSLDPKRLPGKHGLSLLIDVDGRRMLYDFGPGDVLSANCNTLEIPLETIELAILSHSHMDHGGGINTFLTKNSAALLYAMRDIRTDLFTRVMNLVQVPIGVRVKKKHQNRIKILTGVTEISRNVHLLDFPDYTNRSTLNKELYIRDNHTLIPDNFYHESILVIEEDGSLAVLNACSHHGVMATLLRVSELFPNKRIKSYAGGFHLCNPVNGKCEDERVILETARQMQSWGIDYYTGHCTGKAPFAIMKSILGESLHSLSTGMRFSLNLQER